MTTPKTLYFRLDDSGLGALTYKQRYQDLYAFFPSDAWKAATSSIIFQSDFDIGTLHDGLRTSARLLDTDTLVFADFVERTYCSTGKHDEAQKLDAMFAGSGYRRIIPPGRRAVIEALMARPPVVPLPLPPIPAPPLRALGMTPGSNALNALRSRRSS